MRLALLLVTLVAAPVLALPPAFDDAPLRAVRFVDANEGWAVGDQGGIWHSIDGGKSWDRQPTGSKASLRAVQFLTPYTGFVVGRVELPNRAGSAGVVLGTTDGGATWKELSSTLMPGLNGVKFFDETNGIVVGDGSPGFPSGVFRTTDGGATWAEVAGPRTGSWLGLDLADAETGLLAGTPGPAMLKTGKLDRPTLLAGLPACAAVVRSGNRVLFAGLDSKLYKLADDGTTFSVCPVPPVAVRSFTTVGDHVYAVGRPGSVILHSPNFGTTWEVLPTGSPVPLHGIQMLDDKSGWAVGELGTVLGTTDGGKSWTLRKSGGQKAAVMVATARPQGVPLGAVALLGAKDGYLTATVTVTSADEAKLAMVTRMAGGAMGEADGSRTWPSYLLEPPAEPGPVAVDETLVARFVLAIRTWRPEVIIGDLASPDAPLCDRITLVALKEAFTRAADPAAFPDHVALGLAPHAAKKLYAQSPAGEANVTYDLTAFTPGLADAVKDFTEPADMILTGPGGPDRVHFRLVAHRLPGSETHTAIMQGIEIAEGGTARRKKPEFVVGDLAAFEKVAASRRQLETMTSGPVDAAKLAQIVGVLNTLPPEPATRGATAAGFRLAAAGQWTAAREIMSLVADRYALHPDAVEAIRWLTAYHGSAEARRRIELGHHPVFQTAAFVAVDPATVRQAGHSDGFAPKPAVRFATPESFGSWLRVGPDLEGKLAASGAAYSRDPLANLSRLAARRTLGLQAHATTQLKGWLPMDGLDPTDLWRAKFADEARLLNGAEPTTTQRVECRPATVRPFLDGKLDDVCWKDAPVIALPDTAGYATEARFARDDGFLYVGIVCQHPEGKQVAKAEKRSRDADLRGHDRIELTIDLDRDTQTAYRLRVDHRGCVADDCWGDSGWNPRWFVAVEPTATGWTAEVAIPLAELSATPPTAGNPWGLAVHRIVPGITAANWGGETMGYLLFPAK